MADVEKHKRLSPADRARLGGQLEQAYTQGASLASLAASHPDFRGTGTADAARAGVVLRRLGGSTRTPDPGRLERAQVTPATTRPAPRSRNWAAPTESPPRPSATWFWQQAARWGRGAPARPGRTDRPALGRRGTGTGTGTGTGSPGRRVV